ncbi:restriction endonuclease subunit S [Methanosarcina sp.]|uniref:restriction endonuclease subunit S n=1 Tax=Methanosarcina sp. TaxID=2213 RepID=UPI003C73002F
MDRVPISNDEYEKFKLKKGDLLFARQSLVLEGAGKCSIIMDDIIPATFESHIIRGRLNEKLADPLFYYYFFKSATGRNLVSSIVEQVAAAGIRGSDLSKLSVLYLPKEEQKSIANIFSTLDDKIDLNRQMNSTLKQIAQSLFKRWFIDFEFPDENGDPYKSSGGRMVDSKLGEIPEGWGIGKLGDIASEKRKNVKVEDMNPETPYFGLEHIPRKSISLSDWGNASEISSNKLIFEKRDILFGNKTLLPQSRRSSY